MPYLRKQITIKERIVEDLPTLNQIYRLLIHDLTYAGKLQVAGRIEDAKAIYRQAMKHAEKGVADDPQSKEDRNVEGFNGLTR